MSHRAMPPARPALPRRAAKQPARACLEEPKAVSLRFDAVASRALLTRLPPAEHLPTWQHFARDPDLTVRQAVASKGPAALWTELAQDSSHWVRQTVARRAAASPDHQALAGAQRHDQSFWVRLSAVQGLAGQAHGLHLLQTYLEHDSASVVRATAAQAWPRWAPSTALAARLAHEPVDWVRHVILRKLALIDPEAARQAFHSLPVAKQGPLASVLRNLAPKAWERPLSAVLRGTDFRPLADLPTQELADLLQRAEDDKVGVHGVESKRAALLTKAVAALSRPHGLGSDSPFNHALFLLHQPEQACDIGRKLRDGHVPELGVALTVVEMLRSSDKTFARRMAARLLGKMPHESDTVPMLHSLLLDPDAAVRKEAVEAFEQVCAQIEDRRRCLPAARHIAATADHALRERGIKMLKQIGTDATLPALADALRQETSHRARQKVIGALVAHPAQQAWRLLETVLRDPDPKLRAHLAQLLRSAPPAPAYNLLAQLLRDPQSEVQAAATGTLCAHAQAGDVEDRVAALRLLDTVERLGNPNLCQLRALVLFDALRVVAHDADMVAMLHGWAERIDGDQVALMSQFAKSDYVGREPLLIAWLDSPHPAVAAEAQRLVGERMKQWEAML